MEHQIFRRFCSVTAVVASALQAKSKFICKSEPQVAVLYWSCGRPIFLRIAEIRAAAPLMPSSMIKLLGLGFVFSGWEYAG